MLRARPKFGALGTKVFLLLFLQKKKTLPSSIRPPMPEPRSLALRLAEALVFASAEPVPLAAVAAALPEGEDAAAVLSALRRDHEGRGVELVEVAGGWQFRTAPDLSARLGGGVARRRRLPRAAMEVLAAIAYRQPVTRAEVEALRGAALGQPTLDLLLEEGLIRPAGRRDAPGRPVLWVTTPHFLAHFGLRELSDLPRRDDLPGEGTSSLPEAPPPMPGEAAPQDARLPATTRQKRRGGGTDPGEDPRASGPTR